MISHVMIAKLKTSLACVCCPPAKTSGAAQNTDPANDLCWSAGPGRDG
jgi:hypothetical protein